jgi:hypothetical protein
MLTRLLLLVSVWVPATFGAARLFGRVGLRAGVAVGVLALCFLAWSSLRRRRRLRVWNTSGGSDFPPGPRRVLLAETGLSRPQ